MKPTTTRVVRLLAALLMLGAVLATSASPAGASASKASTVAATSSHATVASTTATAASTQNLVAAMKKAKCTTFWCLHPGCHTYRCWFKYCHTWFCIHKHHMHPYGHPFVNRPPPKMTVKSTAFTQGGTFTLAVDDASSVRLSLVGSNKKAVSLGSFKGNLATGTQAVKLPAGLSGAYSLIATDAVSHESSSMAMFIRPAASKLTVAPATKLASDRTATSNVGFSAAVVIGLGVLAVGMLGSGSTMLLLGRRRRTWKARA